MILVDTSAWIEWLIGSPTGEKLDGHLPEQAEWLVPTMVQLELAKWLTREVGEDKADQVIGFTQLCTVVPLHTAIALAAATAEGLHGSGGALLSAEAQAAFCANEQKRCSRLLEPVRRA